MELRFSEKSLCLVKNEKERFVLFPEESFLSVGKVDASYRMSRGSFKIKQKKLSKKKLFLSSVEKTKNGALLTLSDSGGKKEMELTLSFESENLLKFTPKLVENRDFNRMTFRVPAKPNEAVYGGGETFAAFNLRGKKQRVWVAEHINAGQIARKIVKSSLGIKAVDRKQPYKNYETYYAQPTFMSSEKYFVHCDTTEYALFNFKNKEYHEITVNDFSAKILKI